MKAWKKLNPSTELASKIIRAVEEQKKQESWIKANGQFIPYPSSYLNGERWEDEIVGVKPENDMFRGAL